ncbi:Metallo-dependent phosphatase-like protein [Thamnocephalis sphaerospora]|uniref:Metallo-dependent phosphatase-like protein n=1 Tax=Thamnocephalis sphaerospora TaxID=78915 RepID=A0A4P9XVA8_9FUNG|nr:Metallo-dependent phosphatase-like protein [Thamnocephalis sphaerospora]|eukprot:RKP10214.1 Metallo-dependent phosphatase-like protein [Thamnocephalis sphaerospora]
MLVGDDGGARPLDSPLFRARCWNAKRVNQFVQSAQRCEDFNSETFRPISELGRRRIIAVGDLHGDMESALSVLRMANVVDENGKWVGNNTVLVQTGNVIDQGPDTKDLLSLFPRLAQEANRVGGRVIQLLGEHEIMNMMGDLRFVKERPDEFLSPESRAITFSSTGYLGFRLFNLPLAHRVGHTVFAHSGIAPRWAASGIQTINRLAKSGLSDYALKSNSSPHADQLAILGASGPTQYANYTESSESIACNTLWSALSIMNVQRMVIGRQLQKDGKITSRCGARLLFINTGISSAIAGKQSALEILPDGEVRAIYPSGSVTITL